MNNSGSRYTIERPLRVMIGACVLVIVCAISLMAVGQQDRREEQIRERGIGLARLLAGLPSEQLATDNAYQSMLQLVSFSQSSRDFAYAALVSSAGMPVAEVTAPGVIVPAASVASEPSGWIGERSLALQSGGRAIMEFYAPIFHAGDLAGQIRLGYYRPTYMLLYEQLPAVATLALLIFSLTPLLYFLLRHEIRPLADASLKVEQMLRDSGGQQVTIGTTPSLATFIERFNQFAAVAERRIHELEEEHTALVASTRLLSYEKSRIELTLQALPDGVLVIDEHGKINSVNERATVMLGASKNDILSKPPIEWCEQEEIEKLLACYETSGATRYPADTLRLPILREKKSSGTLSVNAYPLFSPKEANEIYGTLVIIRDITEESLAQAQRTEFIAHLGHELKTPLNTLFLYSEMLLDMKDIDEAERVAAVNTIHDEVERLSSLVNNLMSLSRIELGSLDLEKQRVRIGDLLEDIRLSLGKNATQNDVRINLNMPRELDAISVDKDLLRIAINNLVSNAIKYNNPGGSVTIDAEETDEALLIRVSDTGIGMAPEDCNRVFDKFYRSESTDVRQRAGHGLGLSLANEIVALHGGAISVESELGAGSRFTISLVKRFGLMKQAI